MENAPRNIPGIVWEQFSRQPRNDVSFPLRYINPEVAGPQQTATALPGASTATLKEPLITRDYYQTNQEKQTTDWGKKLKDSPEDRLSTFQKIKLGPGFLLNTHKKNISNMLMLTVLVVFLGNFNLVFSSSSSCPSVCECPLEMPKCAPGVSVVLDGCGCCKVCARQLNEDCSLTEPCDHTKGLECNFGASFAATTRGICRAKSEGRPCEYNSRIYQNGESFQPNCKHQCTCIDGAVGCVPLCPQELSLPNLGCANPRLVKVAGQCCEEWVCDDGKETDILEKLFGKDTVTDESERDLTNRNELIDIVKGGLKSLPAFRVQPEGHMFDNQKCIVQTTPWSQCSKTCGTGISTRVTNNNSECKLVRETRICEVRPCTQSPYSSLKKGKKCSRTKKSSQPVKFTYAGCSSLKKYRPKYCGACVDGRCCSPHDTRTIRVKFRCEDGETFNKNVMMIESCKCTYNCPHANEASYPFYRLSNDIHKFRD